MVSNKFTTEWNEIRYIVVIVGGSGNHINTTTKEIKNNNAAQVIKKAKQQILDAWRVLETSQNVYTYV